MSSKISRILVALLLVSVLFTGYRLWVVHQFAGEVMQDLTDLEQVTLRELRRIEQQTLAELARIERETKADVARLCREGEHGAR